MITYSPCDQLIWHGQLGSGKVRVVSELQADYERDLSSPPAKKNHGAWKDSNTSSEATSELQKAGYAIGGKYMARQHNTFFSASPHGFRHVVSLKYPEFFTTLNGDELTQCMQSSAEKVIHWPTLQYKQTASRFVVPVYPRVNAGATRRKDQLQNASASSAAGSYRPHFAATERHAPMNALEPRRFKTYPNGVPEMGAHLEQR